MDVHTVA